MSMPESLLREAAFQERRRSVLRSMTALALATLAGIGLMLVARAYAPRAFDASVAVFLAAFAASGLAFWYRLRRHWRCPGCNVRWESGDALASAHWTHCPSCGESLRATPEQAAHERIASTHFALGDRSHEELVGSFLRRRRLGRIVAAVAVVCGAAVLVWGQQRGWSELAEQVVVALVAGLVAAVVVTSARCPRCRLGIVAGRGRHCQRCGLLLGRDLSAGADHRTER
jgi:hypothetical protein